MTTDYHDFSTKAMPKEERRKLDIGDIWINSVKCNLCKEVIRSKNRHNQVRCSCGLVSVDGGSWYTKRSWHANVEEEKAFEDISEMYDDVRTE